MEFDKSETVEWVIQDGDTRLLRRAGRRAEVEKGRGGKKTVSLLDKTNRLGTECMDVLEQRQTWERAQQPGLSQFACLGG